HLNDTNLLSFLDPAFPTADFMRSIRDLRLLGSSSNTTCYRPNVRQELLAWWHEIEHKQDYQKVHTLALNYYETIIKDLDDDGRISYQPEIVYHQLIVNESLGLSRLIDWFEEAYSRYAFEEADALNKAALELKDWVQPLTKDWLSYFDLRLDLVYSRQATED